MPKFLEVSDKKAAKEAINADFYLNVMDFGAVGDGVANDTEAIHNAREAAGVGGKIHFPLGTYKVTPLTANVNDQTWLLNDATLVYDGPNNNHAITVDATGVTIIGGTIEMSAIAPQLDPPVWRSFGIFANTGSDGLTIRDVTIKDAPGHGIYVLLTNNVVITGCTILNQTYYGIATQNSTADTDMSDFLIEGNLIITDSVSYGVGIFLHTDNDTMTVSRARVANNTVVLPYGSSPLDFEYPDGGRSGALCITSGRDCVVDGNVTFGGWSGMTMPRMERTTFSNNTCRGWWSVGIETAGKSLVISDNVLDADGHAEEGSSGFLTSDWPCENVTITGNVFTGFSAEDVDVAGGLFFGSFSQVNNVTVAGNTITAGGGSGVFNGIVTNGDTTNFTIIGNTFDGSSRTSSRGILLQGHTHTGMSVVGNNFSNCGEAFFPAVLTDGEYSNMRYTGNLVRNCDYSIYSDDSSIFSEFILDSTINDANGNTAINIVGAASAVNYLEVTNGATGGWVQAQARSETDANVNLTLKSQGTGFVAVQNGSGDNLARFANGTTPGNAANYVTIQSAATGNPCLIQAVGTDTNISINVTTAGTGTLRHNGTRITTINDLKLVAPASWTSGNYYTASVVSNTSTSNTLGNGTVRATPYYVSSPLTISALVGEHTASGESGSVLRLAVWDSTGTNGTPGAIVAQGTVSTSGSAAVQQVSVSATLQPGLYYFGGAVQAAATTQPTIRTSIQTIGPFTWTSLPASLAPVSYVAATSVTSGAFSTDTWTPSTTQAPRVAFQVA